MSSLGIEVQLWSWGKGQLSINSSCTDKNNENICSSSEGIQEEGRFLASTSIGVG